MDCLSKFPTYQVLNDVSFAFGVEEVLLPCGTRKSGSRVSSTPAKNWLASRTEKEIKGEPVTGGAGASTGGGGSQGSPVRIPQKSSASTVKTWGHNERFFFEANTLGSEFHFFKNSKLLKFAKHVEKTVFLNDSTCYWQSISSEEIVHRASFLTGDFFSKPLLVGVEFPCFVSDHEWDCCVITF